MSKQLTERERQPDDEVVTASAAAEIIGRSRQAVDKGLREGRIPGFRDPATRKLWVQRVWVVQHAHGGPQLLARMDEVEAQVKDRVTSLEKENATLREEVTTAKELNLLLLAAADERDKAETLLDKAVQLDDDAKAKRRKAAKRARRAAQMYREAISQTQLPGSPAGMEATSSR